MRDRGVAGVEANNFLENDQAVIRNILQELGENPDDVRVFFHSDSAGQGNAFDTVTYSPEGATRTVRIHNSGHEHFVPMEQAP